MTFHHFVGPAKQQFCTPHNRPAGDEGAAAVTSLPRIKHVMLRNYLEFDRVY